MGFKVTSLVSDRAKGLVKLGDGCYLDVCPMPDLFHFVQSVNLSSGLQVGKKLWQAVCALSKATDEAHKPQLEAALAVVRSAHGEYREQIEEINKTVHAFDQTDAWASGAGVEKGLLRAFSQASKVAGKVGIEIDVDKASKVLSQISPIAQGVQAWVEQAQVQIQQLVASGSLLPQEQDWFVQCALPRMYWEEQVHRTQPKAKNKNLRAYYKDRAQAAALRMEEQAVPLDFQEDQKANLLLCAQKLARSFQRASSQVEGRNGYLSFMNHGCKGVPNKRLEVLTVVHNYDIRRDDGSTPAQRLFQRDFPDVFEFVLQSVTGFKEPRKRNHK